VGREIERQVSDRIKVANVRRSPPAFRVTRWISHLSRDRNRAAVALVLSRRSAVSPLVCWLGGGTSSAHRGLASWHPQLKHRDGKNRVRLGAHVMSRSFVTPSKRRSSWPRRLFRLCIYTRPPMCLPTPASPSSHLG